MLARGVLALACRGQTQWQPTDFEGVSMARLYEDPARSELASLVRIARRPLSPGDVYGLRRLRLTFS